MIKRRTAQFILFLFLFFLLTAGAEANTNVPQFYTGPVESLGTPAKDAAGDTESKKADTKPSHKKLGTDLVQLVDDNQLPPGQTREELKRQMQTLKQFRPASAAIFSADGKAPSGDMVNVYIYLKPSAANTHVVDSYAAKVADRDEKNRLAVAWVEVKNLEALASLDVVRTIRTVLPPLVRTGSVTSQGDAILRADKVRSQYGKNGSGLKVGIISDGVDHWTNSVKTGDLPSNLTVLSNTLGGDEGTAMLEIVNDLAPGAQLYFHDAGLNIVAFDSAIDQLVAAGCKVICDDVGWPAEPSFEDGTVAKHVASVLEQNDIVYVSAAGNDATGHYRGMYYNDGNNYQDFSGGTSQYKRLYLDIPPAGDATIVLKWDDKFGASGNDYDLYLKDNNTGQILAKSTDTQNGSGDPLEAISFQNTGSTTRQCYITVNNYQGKAAAKTLDVIVYGNNKMKSFNITPSYSIFGQPAVPKVLAVGAINVSNPNQIAQYSSEGPVTIEYPSLEKRNKPDICGIDGVAITGAGGFENPFYGTSAAAPHVAAIAALLWSKSPGSTAATIRNALTSTAVDLGDAGFDYVYGYGRADALNAYSPISDSGSGKVTNVTVAADKTSQPTGTTVTLTASATGSSSPLYQFWVQSPRDNTWTASGDYSSSNTYSFTEAIPGTYTVYVYAKSSGTSDPAAQSVPVNVTFTKNNAVRALTVTGPNGSQAVGSSATFTAQATDDGGIPKYQFWLHDSNGWRVVQDYSTNNTFTMNNLQPGSYVMDVFALDTTDITNGNWKAVYHQVFIVNVNSSVQLNAPTTVAVGGNVNVSAQATGLTGEVYQFWYQSPDGIWHGSDYSSSKNYSFTANSKGVYTVAVYSKDLYAPNTAQFSVSNTVTVNCL